MKSIDKRVALLAGAVGLLSGCGNIDGKRDSTQFAYSAPVSEAPDTPVTIGGAYVIDGVTYTPADIVDYDEVGYAGRLTAKDDAFGARAISAAHKTLPLPSYVEVTALDTGRTILVRINDRGPMANDRLIDLSPGAAQQLGMGEATVGVRVRRTNPPMAERAQLRAGNALPERLATPNTLLAILRTKLAALPRPAALARPAAASVSNAADAGPTASAGTKPGDDRFIIERPRAPAMTPKSADYVVQVAAFSSESRASSVAASVGGTVSKVRDLWRVRVGPFGRQDEAQNALNQVKAEGFRDAVVLRDR